MTLSCCSALPLWLFRFPFCLASRRALYTDKWHTGVSSDAFALAGVDAIPDTVPLSLTTSMPTSTDYTVWYSPSLLPYPVYLPDLSTYLPTYLPSYLPTDLYLLLRPTVCVYVQACCVVWSRSVLRRLQDQQPHGPAERVRAQAAGETVQQVISLPLPVYRSICLFVYLSI